MQTTIPLLLLLALFCLATVLAVQTNYTIDDASSLVTYRGSIDRNLTGFDPSRLNNGTVTFIPATENDSPTISMNFTGTAVYVFVAYPAGHNISFTSGFIARIDGIPSGGWALANTAPLYNHLAYRNLTLKDGPHNLVLQVQPEWELYFDYVVYTMGEPDSTSHKKSFPVAAVAGGVAGGIALLALLAIPCVLRRRAIARRKPRPLHADDATHLDKDLHGPAPIPYLLPTPSTLASPRKKSALRVGIPLRRSSRDQQRYSGNSPDMPLSSSSTSDPVSPALLLMAEEIHRLGASMQRLEARDGGPVQLPPAYGRRGVESADI